MDTDFRPSNLGPSDDTELIAVAGFFKSIPNFSDIVGAALRKSLDEVIDGPRTGRYRVEELEKTEKTYIGTKVEIVLRKELNLERGSKSDNLVMGYEVDTKFSLKGEWMIPSEAIGMLCLLVSCNDNKGTFAVGLLRMTADVLREKNNKDGKTGVSKYGKTTIEWLAHGMMPKNLLLNLENSIRDKIISQKSGVQRISMLFRCVTGLVIPRNVIEQVARQKDPLKRAREAKENLAAEGYTVLCGRYKQDSQKLKNLGFEMLGNDEWISIKK